MPDPRFKEQKSTFDCLPKASADDMPELRGRTPQFPSRGKEIECHQPSAGPRPRACRRELLLANIVKVSKNLSNAPVVGVFREGFFLTGVRDAYAGSLVRKVVSHEGENFILLPIADEMYAFPETKIGELVWK